MDSFVDAFVAVNAFCVFFHCDAAQSSIFQAQRGFHRLLQAINNTGFRSFFFRNIFNIFWTNYTGVKQCRRSIDPPAVGISLGLFFARPQLPGESLELSTFLHVLSLRNCLSPPRRFPSDAQ